MDAIRVVGGDNPHELDGRELEAARSRIGPEHEGTMPVCSAPWRQLLIDPEGQAWTCRASVEPFGKQKFADVKKAWKAGGIERLRESFTAGELDGQHCAKCVRSLDLGLVAQAPLVRDQVAVPLDGLKASLLPPHLVLRLDLADHAGGDPAALTKRIVDRGLTALRQNLGEHLEELELEARDVLSHGAAWAIFEELSELDAAVCPSLTLRTSKPPTDLELRSRVLPVRPQRIVLVDMQHDDVERALIWGRQLVGAEGQLDVQFVLDGDNWFDVHRVATLSGVFGANLELRGVAESGDCPMLGLPLSEQRVLDAFLTTLTGRTLSGGSAQVLSATELDPLVREVRRLIEVRAAELQFSEPERALRGEGARLRMPSADHPALVDLEIGAAIVAALALLEEADVVCEWAHEVAAVEGMLDVARSRPALRLLLQKAAMAGANESVWRLLREVYGGTVASRKQLRTEEEALGESGGAGWAVRMWAEQLGFDRLKRRRAPFAIPKKATEKSEAVDVTVLIPSYRHEDYIGDCVRSALRQTYPGIRVVVADDRSPDATAARAKAVSDPNLEVLVNESNLGLGDSVLKALESIDTPYVALLNSDDVFHPERIERCREVLDADPDAQLVATGLHLIDPSGHELKPENVSRLTDGRKVFEWVNWYERTRPESLAPEVLFAALIKSNFLATSSNLVCRTDFLRSEAEAIRSLEFCLDMHLFLAASVTGGLRYLPERLAAYRLHPSNTVWFEEDERWNYFLEVNRVAVTNLRRFRDVRTEKVGESVARAESLAIVAEGLAENTEVAGLGALACEMFGGFELDKLAHDDEDVRGSVRRLQRLATRAVQLRYATESVGDDAFDSWVRRSWVSASLGVARVLSEVRGSQAGYWRGSAKWARRRLEHLESRLKLAEQAEAQLRAGVARMSTSLTKGGDVASVSGDVAERLLADASQFGTLVQAADVEFRDLRRELSELQAEHAKTQDRLMMAEKTSALEIDRRIAVEQRQSATRAEKQAAQERLDEVKGQLSEVRGQISEMRVQLESVRTELSSVSKHSKKLDDRRLELRSELDEAWAVQSKLRAELERERVELRRTRDALNQQELAADGWRVERDTMLGSREMQVGNFMWNKIPFFAKSRRFVKRVYHRVRETGARAKMERGRRSSERSEEPSAIRIAAAATPVFPIRWHTFVYQELLSMREMFGAELGLFHVLKGDSNDLHDAFRPLESSLMRFAVHRETHQADYKHYVAAQPERVAELVDALASESGLTREQVEEKIEFLSAFTFTRRVEAWGGDYIHTYFFYNQSLWGFVAQWLLGIPRGVSTYADHMLNDWPLKSVALQLRHADVIVATSKRIRDELIGIAGEEIASRVVVKPNGIDGRQFRRSSRTAPVGEEWFELACVARIEPKKGLVELVEALAILRERGCRVRVHLLGSVDKGQPRSENYITVLDRRVDELGVSEWIEFHGAVSRDVIIERLAKCHAMVAPFVEVESGDKDGIPTAILEGIAAGLPVVATDAGSIPEILDDGVEGIIVGQRDPSALADAIEALAKDPDRLREMGLRAHARFEREFDVSQTEPRLHERIAAAVAASRAGRG